MFLVFGWNKKPRFVKTLLRTDCHHCKKETQWDWIKMEEWLELFFINTIPFRSESYLICKTCSDNILLSKEDSAAIKILDKLNHADSQTLHDKVVNQITTHQLGHMTENQINWIKSYKHTDSDN